MGSNYNGAYKTTSSYTEEAARIEIESKMNQLISDYGNDSYAGHIGIKDGIKFYNRTFTSYKEADEFIEKTSGKWDPVAVVKLIIEPSNDIKDDVLEKRLDDLEVLKDDRRDYILTSLESRKKVRNTATCNSCGKHSKIDNVNYSGKCPHCNKPLFYLSKTELNRVKNVLDKRIKNKQDEVNARKRVLDRQNKKNNVIFEDLKKAISEKNSIQREIDKERSKAFNSDKKTLYTCSCCGSKINLGYLRSSQGNTCPVCEVGSIKIVSEGKLNKLKTLKNTIRELEKKCAKESGTTWVYGGWSAE